MTKCGACNQPATVGVKWGSQGQLEALCDHHAEYVIDTLSGAVAKLETPSPTIWPLDVFLSKFEHVDDDKQGFKVWTKKTSNRPKTHSGNNTKPLFEMTGQL